MTWRPCGEPPTARYGKRNKSFRFLLFLSNSLTCGSSAPPFPPAAASNLPLASASAFTLATAVFSSSPDLPADFPPYPASPAGRPSIACRRHPEICPPHPLPQTCSSFCISHSQESLCVKTAFCSLKSDYKQSFSVLLSLSLDQVQRVPRSNCSGLQGNGEGLMPSACLGCVSPVKERALSVQRNPSRPCSLHSTAASS